MKRFMYVLLAVMLLTSCSQAERFGNVSFTRETSRDLFASIEYPDENSLLWDITATKLSSGSNVGEGLVEDALLTDTFGPFSVGRWSFELNGKKDGTVVYHGSTTAQITEGPNPIEVVLSSVGEKGTLIFAGCNFPFDNGSGAEYSGAQIYIDGERVFGINRLYCTRGDSGLWSVPEQETALTPGLHDVEIMLNGNEPITVERFKVRIEPGLTTSVTFGTFEGVSTFVITLETKEAIEEE
ncbi:MAG: hypothetical protein IJT52_02455 [Spirochaetales bacterium]|nr:hypothetical protein [Spirochaetales bacterium]